MLKRLELIGFKSFADRTRFDFGPGVTAVVGPNGSGKSNVVDAIRWILGEQSAKSLRGKEMSDVIFNGSGGRRSLGMAEVSLAFDNRRHFLPIESDEVVIARRVYRSGEGEYFINGQLARLRDIKDMFLGTGAGIGAYSIIEQGKVDQMLQASPQDRRAIFEEAAGISKFRVQKAETARRLDRVGQNLLRIQDIHEELEKQLRGLRSQAGKARKYKDYADRLKELRLGVGRRDLATLDERLAANDAGRSRRQAEMASLDAKAIAHAELLEELEAALADSEEAYAQKNAALATVKQGWVALEAEMVADRERAIECERQRLDAGQRLITARRFAAEAETLFNAATAALSEKTTLFQTLAADVETRRADDGVLVGAMAALRSEHRQVQQRSMQLVQSLARLENEQSGLESNLRLLVDLRDRLTAEFAELEAAARQFRLEIIGLTAQRMAGECQQRQLNSRRDAVAAVRAEIARSLAELDAALFENRRRQAALVDRIELLETLQRRHEGLSSGVREALAQRDAGAPEWSTMVGILVEQLAVPREYAELVELALGSYAEALLIACNTVDENLVRSAEDLAGRVLLLPLNEFANDVCRPLVVLPEDFTDPSLADVVECSARLKPLVDRLLGGVYVVENFAAARQAAAALRVDDRPSAGMRTAFASIRFITRAGEIVEPDGSVVAGTTKDPTAGILSRHAELTALHVDAVELTRRIDELSNARELLVGQLADVDENLDDLSSRLDQLHRQQQHFDAALALRSKSLEQATANAMLARGKIATAVDDAERARAELSRVDEALERTHDELTAANAASEAMHRRVAELEGRREAALIGLNQSSAELAALEERLRALQVERARTDELRARHANDIASETQRLNAAKKLAIDLNGRLLATAAAVAELASQKDAIGELASEAEAIALGRDRRREYALGRDSARQSLDRLRALAHADELQAAQWRHERQALLDRTRDDYGIDLTSQSDSAPAALDEAALDGARLEIAELREKIARLGAVNLEAIAELEELEQRAQALQLQMNDLAVAERHLQQVIGRINEESRRLFIDTFDAIRGHFQDLFRKIFGGGKADVILEDETDVLEAGIEIVARPPGKEPRSISLLSGGEKTMAAVALLMALFRSKPSPFCILDEVDAALDEANIGRFVALIREFTGESQFVLITHSKTTMAAADMLHGVTQRESGVSLRVSVHLDDVDEDGRISATALAS